MLAGSPNALTPAPLRAMVRALLLSPFLENLMLVACPETNAELPNVTASAAELASRINIVNVAVDWNSETIVTAAVESPCAF